MANATGAAFDRPSPSCPISFAALSSSPLLTRRPASRPAEIGFQGESLGGRRFGDVQSLQRVRGHKLRIQFQDSSRFSQGFLIFAGGRQRERETHSHDQIERVLFERTPMLIDGLEGSSYLAEIEIPVPMPQD